MIEVRELAAPFGAEIIGFEPCVPLDDETRDALRDAFDRRGVLVFRDLEIDHPGQVYLAKLLIRKDTEPDDPTRPLIADNWYVSNDAEKDAAAPFGRLQFHADGMWADEPFEIISLYGAEVGQPAVPTTFVNAVHAWRTLPANLRVRVEGLSGVHTSGVVRRGDLTDVLLTNVERPVSTAKPLGLTHPRTGDTVLYACEQMTKELVGLEHDESEELLRQLFDHLYDPAERWSYDWREGDLVVWDNIAVQHARPNVAVGGPPRTLRKVAIPMPRLAPEQMPTYSASN